MKPVKPVKPVVWLFGLAAGLVLVLIYELTQNDLRASAPPRLLAPPIPRTFAGAPAPGAETPSPGPDAGPLDRIASSILARPLFNANRRPAAASAAAGKTAAAGGGVPRLAGTIVGPYERRALFAGDDGKTRSIGEGGVIGAYRVRSIGAGVVIISGPEGDREIRPSFVNPPKIQSDDVRPGTATQGASR